MASIKKGTIGTVEVFKPKQIRAIVKVDSVLRGKAKISKAVYSTDGYEYRKTSKIKEEDVIDIEPIDTGDDFDRIYDQYKRQITK